MKSSITAKKWQIRLSKSKIKLVTLCDGHVDGMKNSSITRYLNEIKLFSSQVGGSM